MATVAFTVKVADSNGNPVSGARVVVLTQQLSGTTRHTDGGGLANFWVGAPFTPPLAFDVLVDAAGYAPWATDRNQGTTPMFGASDLTLNATLSFKRPAGVQQPPLPAFDQSNPDGSGIVYQTLPPEALPLSPNPTKTFFRGDAWGVTLPVSQTPPYVPGANTTPPNMVMSYFLPYYTGPVQSNLLTAHAQRSYSHFHLDQWNWQQAGLSPAQAVQLMAYVQSWGFFTSFWGLSTSYGVNWGSWAQAQPVLQPILSAIQSAGSRVSGNSILLVGEELNACTSPAGLLDIVTNLMPPCADAGIDVWLHFTSNYASWPQPGQSQPDFWADMIGLGVKGLCWQANQTQSTGAMGGEMYEPRLYLAGTTGHVVAFEVIADAQLFNTPLSDGRLPTEGMGRLRGYELNCCPAGNPSILPLAGYGNGGSLPNGLPV